jgi:hypothetical protein
MKTIIKFIKNLFFKSKKPYVSPLDYSRIFGPVVEWKFNEKTGKMEKSYVPDAVGDVVDGKWIHEEK